MTPILSIIVPCYNQTRYLADTLQSVLEQDLEDWECIIVNDGSTDNSETIAKEWQAKDPRFIYIYKENSGVSDTRNKGIQQARGKYILPLDGDDKIGKQYASEAIHILESDVLVKLVYSNSILFGTRDEKIIPNPYSYQSLLTDNQIFCSAIFRRDDFLKTKGYNTNMANGLEDWDFWLTLLNENDRVVKLEGFHFYYRIKDVSRSTQIDKVKNEALLLQIFKNQADAYLKHINPIRSKIEADHYKQLYQTLLQSTEWKIGRIIYYPIHVIKKIIKRPL